jgi:hypothetical protein
MKLIVLGLVDKTKTCIFLLASLVHLSSVAFRHNSVTFIHLGANAREKELQRSTLELPHKLVHRFRYAREQLESTTFKTKNRKGLYSWFGNDYRSSNQISSSEQATIDEYMKFLDRRYQ